MGKLVVFNTIRFAMVLLLQVALFKNMGYYNMATPFPYIFFLFFLPIGIPNLLLFAICFCTGLAVDAFYDSIGVHAGACVWFGFFRIFFIRIGLDIDLRESSGTPSMGETGLRWFLPYLLLGTLAHHAALCFLEAFSFVNMSGTLARIGLSSLFTLSILFVMCLFMYRKKSRFK